MKGIGPAAALGMVAWVALLAGCDESVTGVTPPPFDGRPPALFFPSALLLSAGGDALYVANASFDQRFEAGTLLEIPLATFDAAAASGTTPTLAQALPGGVALSQGLIPRFPDSLLSSTNNEALFLTAKDTDELLVIPLDPAGRIACVETDGEEGKQRDCRQVRVNLGARQLEDPGPLVRTTAVLPNGAGPEPAIFVTHLAPQSTGSEAESHDAKVVGIPESALLALLSGGEDPFDTGRVLQVNLGQQAAAGLAVTNGAVFVGGCLERVTSDLVVACARNLNTSSSRLNPVRFFFPVAPGPSAPAPPLETASLGPVLGGGETRAIAPSSDGQLLYLATSRPNTITTIEAPVPGSAAAPRILSIVPVAESPVRIAVVPRTGLGDLVAVTSFESDAFALVDPLAGLVTSQIRPIGDGPFGLAATTATDGEGEFVRVFVTLFNECGLAEVRFRPADPGAVVVYAKVRDVEGCE